MKVYYENQTEWGKDEYYYLHRVLHRLFSHYERYSDEIRNMDVSRLSDETKVLIYCIICYYHNEFLFDMLSDGEQIRNIKPLKESLVLDDTPLPENNIYKQMNVVY